MGRILTPDQYGAELDDLERRLRALETSPVLNSSSIKEGSTTILDASLTKRVILGQDPSDGTYGVKILTPTAGR